MGLTTFLKLGIFFLGYDQWYLTKFVFCMKNKKNEEKNKVEWTHQFLTIFSPNVGLSRFALLNHRSTYGGIGPTLVAHTFLSLQLHSRKKKKTMLSCSYFLN